MGVWLLNVAFYVSLRVGFFNGVIAEFGDVYCNNDNFFLFPKDVNWRSIIVWIAWWW